MLIGMLAGLWHGLFGVLLSPLGLAGAGGMLNGMQQIIPAQNLPDIETALTGVAGSIFNLVGMLIDVFFGFIGGLVGGAFFGERRAIA